MSNYLNKGERRNKKNTRSLDMTRKVKFSSYLCLKMVFFLKFC